MSLAVPEAAMKSRLIPLAVLAMLVLMLSAGCPSSGGVRVVERVFRRRRPGAHENPCRIRQGTGESL